MKARYSYCFLTTLAGAALRKGPPEAHRVVPAGLCHSLAMCPECFIHLSLCTRVCVGDVVNSRRNFFYRVSVGFSIELGRHPRHRFSMDGSVCPEQSGLDRR